MRDLASALCSGLLMALIGCVIIDPAPREVHSAAARKAAGASPDGDAVRAHGNADGASPVAEGQSGVPSSVANGIAAALGAGTVLIVVLALGSRRVLNGRRAGKARDVREGTESGSSGGSG